MKENLLEEQRDRGEEVRLTLLEAQVGNFVDGGAVTVHEAEELIQEQLLLRVREPTALAAGLHTAHHVLLRRHTHTHTQGTDQLDQCCIQFF